FEDLLQGGSGGKANGRSHEAKDDMERPFDRQRNRNWSRRRVRHVECTSDPWRWPMPELNTEDREKLRKEQFAYVDSAGAEHLPINDESHVRNAMARWNQT